MRWNVLRRRYMAALFELGLLLPVWLAIDALLMPLGHRGMWMLLLLAHSFIGAAAGMRLRAVWQKLLVSLFFGAGTAFAAAGSDWIHSLVYFAVSSFVVRQGMSIADRMDEAVWKWAGLALYFIAAVVFPWFPALQAKVPMLTAAGIVCLAVVLFAANRRFLRYATLAGERRKSAPSSLRRHNAIFMGSILIGAVVLTALFGNAFGSLLYRALRWLFGLLSSAEPAPPAPPPAPPPSMPQGFPAKPQEPGLFGLILDMIGYLIMGLIIAFLVGAAIYWLYKHSGGLLREWLKRLLALLTRSGREEEGASYTDEESSVFSWEAAAKHFKESWLGRLARRNRGERWEDMRTNADRVRYLYRTWLRGAMDKGYEPQKHLTPKETEADAKRWAAGSRTGTAALAEPPVELYYRVRYGEKHVTEAEVERVRKKLQS